MAEVAVAARAGALVSQVDVEVAGGQLLAILGPVGSGKSTILATAAGEAVIQGGDCVVAARRVAYLPQDPWVKNGSVLENITMRSGGLSLSAPPPPPTPPQWRNPPETPPRTN